MLGFRVFRYIESMGEVADFVRSWRVGYRSAVVFNRYQTAGGEAMAGDGDLLADFGKFGFKADDGHDLEAGGGRFCYIHLCGIGLKAVVAGDGIGNGELSRETAQTIGGDFNIGSLAIEAQLNAVIIGGEGGALDTDCGAGQG